MWTVRGTRDSFSQYSLGFSGLPAAPRIGRLQVALLGNKTKPLGWIEKNIVIRYLELHLVVLQPELAVISYLMPVGVLISLARISSTTLSLAFLGASSTT